MKTNCLHSFFNNASVAFEKQDDIVCVHSPVGEIDAPRCFLHVMGRRELHMDHEPGNSLVLPGWVVPGHPIVLEKCPSYSFPPPVPLWTVRQPRLYVFARHPTESMTYQVRAVR